MERVHRGPDGVVVYSSSVPGGSAAFDEIIFCCGAESALHALGAGASWLERRLLRNVTYYDDLIVTHQDEGYMRDHYQFDRVAAPSDEAPVHGRDMYFVRCDPDDPCLIEMSFNLTAYQPHLQGRPTIYQSIFLDEALRHTWTVDAIDPGKVLKKRSTRQFAHTWTHFAFWVPFVSAQCSWISKPWMPCWSYI